MAEDRKAASISMVSIGERLKNAREKKSLTIDQAQKQTHIHSTVIVALEAGRCDEILTPTYVKSFLKKYSAYLGLDSVTILQEYMALHPEMSDISLTGIVNRKPASENLDPTSRILFALSFVILFLAVVFSLAFLGKKISMSLRKYSTGNKKPSLSLRHKERTKRIAPSLEKTRPKKPEAVSKAASQTKEPFKLVMKVKKNTLVKLKRDGETMFDSVLKAGTTETITAKEKIDIFVAKAEAVELILDGKSMGSPGRGVIKNLEITRKGVNIR